jgi:hypothetical protein
MPTKRTLETAKLELQLKTYFPPYKMNSYCILPRLATKGKPKLYKLVVNTTVYLP